MTSAAAAVQPISSCWHDCDSDGDSRFMPTTRIHRPESVVMMVLRDNLQVFQKLTVPANGLRSSRTRTFCAAMARSRASSCGSAGAAEWSVGRSAACCPCLCAAPPPSLPAASGRFWAVAACFLPAAGVAAFARASLRDGGGAAPPSAARFSFISCETTSQFTRLRGRHGVLADGQGRRAVPWQLRDAAQGEDRSAGTDPDGLLRRSLARNFDLRLLCGRLGHWRDPLGGHCIRRRIAMLNATCCGTIIQRGTMLKQDAIFTWLAGL